MIASLLALLGVAAAPLTVHLVGHMVIAEPVSNSSGALIAAIDREDGAPSHEVTLLIRASDVESTLDLAALDLKLRPATTPDGFAAFQVDVGAVQIQIGSDSGPKYQFIPVEDWGVLRSTLMVAKPSDAVVLPKVIDPNGSNPQLIFRHSGTIEPIREQRLELKRFQCEAPCAYVNAKLTDHVAWKSSAGASPSLAIRKANATPLRVDLKDKAEIWLLSTEPLDSYTPGNDFVAKHIEHYGKSVQRQEKFDEIPTRGLRTEDDKQAERNIRPMFCPPMLAPQK